LVCVDTRISEDPRKRAAFQFSMKGHHKGRRVVNVAKTDVTATLAHSDPAQLFERHHQVRPGDNG